MLTVEVAEQKKTVNTHQLFENFCFVFNESKPKQLNCRICLKGTTNHLSQVDITKIKEFRGANIISAKNSIHFFKNRVVFHSIATECMCGIHRENFALRGARQICYALR